jgi:hypothetical protein
MIPVRSRHNQQSGMPVEHAEGDRRNREKIHGRDVFLMVTKKGQRALGWVRGSGIPFHPAGNCSFGNLTTEHGKISVDAGSSPAGVLGHHLEDQIPNFFRCLPSAGRLADLRNNSPVPTESGVVPSDNGFRRDDEESLFPA